MLENIACFGDGMFSWHENRARIHGMFSWHVSCRRRHEKHGMKTWHEIHDIETGHETVRKTWHENRARKHGMKSWHVSACHVSGRGTVFQGGGMALYRERALYLL